MALSAIVVILIIALYLPPVQNFALQKILTEVNSDPSIHVSVEQFRLSPPLHIQATDFTLQQQGDTIATVDNLDLRVSLWPLLRGNVGVNQLLVDDASFTMAGSDSTINLAANIGSLQLQNAEIGLFSKQADIEILKLSRSRINLNIPSDNAEPTDSTPSSPLPWKLNLDQFRIDSISYSMSMAGTIDKLDANIGAALIENTAIDLYDQTVDVNSFIVEHLKAIYLTPETVEETTPKTAQLHSNTISVDESKPWQVKVAHIDLKADSALYGRAGALPQPGFDLDYIAIDKVNIIVDSLLSRGSELKVPIKRIAAHERSGLDLRLSGLFAMNSDSILAHDIKLGTLYSSISLDAMLGMKGNGLPMPLNVTGLGYLSPIDVKLAMPTLTPMMAGIPANSNLDLKINIDGRNGVYNINTLSIELPRCFDIGAKGSIAGVPGLNTMSGDLKLSGHLASGHWVKPTLTAIKLDKTITLQPLSLNGKVKFNHGTISGSLTATTNTGRLAMDASWTGRSESYNANIVATSLPIESFMPALGIENITSTASITGNGYNPMNPKTTIDADINLSDITYLKHRYTDIKLLAHVADGNAAVTVTSGNPDIDFDIRARGNLAEEPLKLTVNADIEHVDLQAMGLSDSIMNGSIRFNGQATLNSSERNDIAANLNVEQLDWNMAGNTSMSTTDLKLNLISNDSLASVSIKNHDLNASIEAPCNLDSIMACAPRLTAAIDTLLINHDIKVTMLQQSLPPFSFDMTAGQDNIISSYLSSKNMGLRSLLIKAYNDSLVDISTRLLGFNSGTTLVDTITANIYQTGDTLNYRFHLGNRPGTLDQWASVSAHGQASGNQASLLFDQQNIDRKTGYRLGFVANWMPDEIYVHVVPTHPVIGYKTWTVNDSNFVSVNMLKKHIDANLYMNSSESSIHLFTSHETDSVQEDLNLKIKDIKLAEWIALNPFAPPVSGDMSADMRFGWDSSSINGNGLISLTDLNYNKQRVGSFDLSVDLSTNKKGTIKANAALLIDSIKTITAEGNLNDSTARNPFLLDFKMIHFPLNVLNPFLPKEMAQFQGTLNGTMDITGSLAEPVFNGYLDFDSTKLTIPMFGTGYTFSDS